MSPNFRLRPARETSRGRSLRALGASLPWLLLAGVTAPGCSDAKLEGAGPPPYSGALGVGEAPMPGGAGSSASAGAATLGGTGTPSSESSAIHSNGAANGAGGNPSTPAAAAADSGGATPSAAAPEAPTPPGSEPNPPSMPPPGSGGRFGLGAGSRCDNGTFAVCEGFEAATLGATAPAGWAFAGYGNRTLRVVDDDSARGDRALRVDVSADQGAVVGMLSRAAGALGQRHFGRSFLKIQAPAPTGFVHFDAFEARGSFNGQENLVRWASTGTNVGTASGNWSWIYNVQSTDHGEFGSEGPRSAHPREGDWMCLEWSIDAGAQEARFWFDSVEVDYLHIDTERAEIPVFDTFNIGFQKFQQTGAWSVWVDEVAFDEQRIGCDG